MRLINLQAPRLVATTLSLLILGFAPEAAAQQVRLPRQVGPFVLSDSTRYDQPELGIGYRFSHPERVRANAYVYPVPPERLAHSDSQRIAQEAEDFLRTLSAGVEQGHYRTIEVVVSEARSFTTADGPRAGYLVAAVFLQGSETFVTLMHLVVLADQYVKTRLSLPSEEWRTSRAPNFGPDLFRQLPLRSSD